jgi:hypothetical protein
MRFLAGRMHPDFDLDGTAPKGPTTVIRAAVDPVRVPEDIETVAIIQRCLCRVTLGEDCYVVQGMTGVTRTISYGAPLAKWEEVCGELLELAERSDIL